GCDICQDVCPWNRKAPKTTEPAFEPRADLFNPDLEEMATLTIEEFREKFKDNSVKRTKYRGFLRNVAVAMGNSDDPKFLPVLQELASSEDELIADHAIWALEKLKRLQGTTKPSRYREDNMTETVNLSYITEAGS
ncbi:tRNA epoxyqueuosine(34) reductase QueG, partial [bacterium]|nr:tRNA epoxyqueuosine(34) reductase QueG [bacterium]